MSGSIRNGRAIARRCRERAGVTQASHHSNRPVETGAPLLAAFNLPLGDSHSDGADQPGLRRQCELGDYPIIYATSFFGKAFTGWLMEIIGRRQTQAAVPSFLDGASAQHLLDFIGRRSTGNRKSPRTGATPRENVPAGDLAERGDRRCRRGTASHSSGIPALRRPAK